MATLWTPSDHSLGGSTLRLRSTLETRATSYTVVWIKLMPCALKGTEGAGNGDGYGSSSGKSGRRLIYIWYWLPHSNYSYLQLDSFVISRYPPLGIKTNWYKTAFVKIKLFDRNFWKYLTRKQYPIKMTILIVVSVNDTQDRSKFRYISSMRDNPTR